MTASSPPALTAAELQRVLAQVEPAALLVSPRVLRRVIKLDRRLPRAGLGVPHRKSYIIGREALLRHADRDELGLASDRELPATVLLFPLPDDRKLATTPRAETLLTYWRLLFHARIHLAVARRRADGLLSDDAVVSRIATIGATEFDEVQSVLEHEQYLLPPADAKPWDESANPTGTYEEFAAVYLELRLFAPDRVGAYFPSITDREAIDRMLAADVDAAAIYTATRLPGAAEPARVPAGPDAAPVGSAPSSTTSATPTERAGRAAAHGNHVRAAITYQREGRPDAAHAEIEHLLARLQHALALSAEDLAAWREPVHALLEPAAGNRWPIERRFLYDLQSLCIDQEHEIFAVDLVEWMVSWGHRPIKRLLPNQPLVLAVKHLHAARHRLPALRIAEPLRLQLVRRMVAAVHRSEHRLRERLRPVVAGALEQVGLKPANYAERVSRDKLVEELLDRIVERRFLSMGDLRDAIARNQLKLPDLAGPREFFLGDKLIRANRQFADNLDGVYRRGEVYLRWLQRLSAAAFGTAIGRFLVLYFILPFGGAYLTLEAIHHVVGIFHKQVVDEDGVAESESIALVNVYTVTAVGVFFFALLHVGPFRRTMFGATMRLWQGINKVLFEWPETIVRLPIIRRVLDSAAFYILCQVLLKPLLWAGGAALACGLFRLDVNVVALSAALGFLVAFLLYNTRLGFMLEESLSDHVMRTWDVFRRDLLPSVYRFVMALFKRLLGDLERIIYAVDELLRFRTGDPRFALIWKPALGLMWFGLTYFVRFVINLFVEPTINPIKHFPVVTVAAKLILPLAPHITRVVTEQFAGQPLMLAIAGAVVTVVFLLIPGFAGFLVWELKENWRLYRSNRSPTLDPAVVGSHGETIVRYLRPGLHSGTIPKLFARLRRAQGTAANRQYEALAHVRDSLRHFVERELLAVLAGSKRWGGVEIDPGDIHLATNRIRIDLTCPALGGEAIAIDLAYRQGFLVAGITFGCGNGEDTWLARLAPAPRAALADALAGFYKRATVQRLGASFDFDAIALTWADWVQVWEQDQAGKIDPHALSDEIPLLPACWDPTK